MHLIAFKVYNYSIHFLDFVPYTPPSGFCSFIDKNLGLGWLWWLIIIIQLGILPALILIQRLCILLPVFYFIHITSILTLYLNTSLWFWVLYMIITYAQCGTGLDNHLFTCVLILTSILLACSVLDCLISREGKTGIINNLPNFLFSTKVGTCWISKLFPRLESILVNDHSSSSYEQ